MIVASGDPVMRRMHCLRLVHLDYILRAGGAVLLKICRLDSSMNRGNPTSARRLSGINLTVPVMSLYAVNVERYGTSGWYQSEREN